MHAIEQPYVVLYREKRSEQPDPSEIHVASTETLQNKRKFSSDSGSQNTQRSFTLRHPEPTPAVLEHGAVATLVMQPAHLHLTEMHDQLSGQRAVRLDQSFHSPNKLRVRDPTHFVQRVHHDEAPNESAVNPI
jgi:hypothetical protein